MDIKNQRSEAFQAAAYEYIPSLQTLASVTQNNLIVTFTSPRHEITQHPNELDDTNNPVSTGFVQSSNPNASPTFTSNTYHNTSSKMSGGAKVGFIVGLTVGLIFVLILLVYLIMRRKYGPDMWKLLSARLFTRARSTKEQRSPEPGSATRRHEEHRSWYMGETTSEYNDGNSKTVLGNLWGSLKGLFTSPDTDTYDPSVNTNAIPLENQQRQNERTRDPRYSLSTVNSPYNTPHDTPRGSPAIVPQTRESSSRVTIPSYYMQYSNQFISPPQTPASSSYRTDTTSTRDSDDTRTKNIGSWAHYQKQRRQQQQKQQQRKSTRPPSVEPINERSAAKFSPSGSSGNRRSTRWENHKHRRSSISSASTLPVFRQHPGEEVDFSPAVPKRRIRSSVLNRLMSS